MNKPIVKIILILFFIIIWVGVVLRAVNFSSGPSKKKKVSKNLEFLIQTDTTELKSTFIYDRDPFYYNKVKFVRPKERNEKKNGKLAIKKSHVEIRKSNNNWPKIEYRGHLRKEGGAEMINALIAVDGQFKYVTLNEESTGVKLVYVNTDSVGIRYKDEIRYFRKETR